MLDVGIVGGGLAGLTLALQLHKKAPDLKIAVFERSAFPPPAGAHKVGEATVEIGAHYLSDTLGLRSMLEEKHLRKFGLRLFFGAGQSTDLAYADELGASSLLPAISYQLDRGALEADLADRLKASGIEFRDNCSVKDVEISQGIDAHVLTVVEDGAESTIACDWVIDASARNRILPRKLKLTEPRDHQMCAVWFRIDSEFSVDDWSQDASWHQRCNGASRRLSTNHLMGSGYWVWIIPLAGGKTSIGLVTDPKLHPLSSFDTFEKFMRWSAKHQPLLAAELTGARPLDFLKLKNLAHACQKPWSTQRWAITGEAGFFADPLYSPGTDFIALSNTLISDLITRECSPMEFGIRSSVYEKMYRSFYESTMSLYEGQYEGFGDTRLMTIKLTWDYAYYWSILAWLYFRDRLSDLNFLRAARPDLDRIWELNEKMQAAFRQRASQGREDQGAGRFFDQTSIPLLVNLNAALLEPTDLPEQELRDNCAQLEAIVDPLLNILAEQPVAPSALLGDLEQRLNH